MIWSGSGTRDVAEENVASERRTVVYCIMWVWVGGFNRWSTDIGSQKSEIWQKRCIEKPFLSENCAGRVWVISCAALRSRFPNRKQMVAKYKRFLVKEKRRKQFSQSGRHFNQIPWKIRSNSNLNHPYSVNAFHVSPPAICVKWQAQFNGPVWHCHHFSASQATAPFRINPSVFVHPRSHPSHTVACLCPCTRATDDDTEYNIDRHSFTSNGPTVSWWWKGQEFMEKRSRKPHARTRPPFGIQKSNPFHSDALWIMTGISLHSYLIPGGWHTPMTPPHLPYAPCPLLPGPSTEPPSNRQNVPVPVPFHQRLKNNNFR